MSPSLAYFSQKDSLQNTRNSTSNITGFKIAGVYWAFLKRALRLLFDEKNRATRRERLLSPGDALFNLIKLSFLQDTMLKYRYMVRFGKSIVIDSTFPPFPSKAFDKRIENYLNNLDLTEIPSGIVSISTTNCCPYSCSFCSTIAHRNPERDLEEDLLKNTIDQVKDLGVPTIILHGGEPLFRYDRFLRLVKHVSDDICLWMFTTGYGLTAERALELKKNGLFGAWVSLDHFDAKVHNELRGHPQAFENACRAIHHFKEAGIYTCLSLVPPDDLLEAENFLRYYDFAKDLGVAEIRILERKPCGREVNSGVVPHSKVLEQLQKDLSRNPKYRQHPPISGLSTWLEKDSALGCQCRFEYLFITSKGDVQPCEASEISFGNISAEPFPSVYQRICAAFPRPSTGCIPMEMFSEIRKYLEAQDDLSSADRAGMATSIMESFRQRGDIPGAYRPLWKIYKRRLQAFRARRMKANLCGGNNSES
jgi:MoaA/NifB/PqqE/SkfB family radical SAM enzyme